MKKENLRIVYMGTPDFAVESLKRLVEKGYNIVGVITMPDKPAGRGHKIQFSPVKQYALSQNLPLLQPEKLKDENFLKALRELSLHSAFFPKSYGTCPDWEHSTYTPHFYRNTGVQHL